ncbi:MAG: sigma-70 family RNA polymerase sigma factor [Myxococcales bacterium]|nr:sigma-70 family RNA polymerase sigma factor [Myxococcales bacterium]
MTTAFTPPLAAAEAELPTTENVEELFRQHGPYVWRTLRRLGLSEADADDLCQEVFLVVFRRLHTFEHRSSLKTWLYGIAVRVAQAHRRRARTQREVPWASPPEVASTVGPHDQLADAQARALLDQALEQLDDDKRAVFVLYEIEQLPMSEVATALECPAQTAYSRLHAARRQVQSFVRRSSQGRWAG